MNTPVRVPSSDGPNLYPQSISPDQRWLAGWTRLPTQFSIAILDRKSQESRFPSEGEGLSFRGANPSWIDANRLIFWDYSRRSAHVWDLRSDEIRALPDLSGGRAYSYQFVVAEEGRALFAKRQRSESDIWLLELRTARTP